MTSEVHVWAEFSVSPGAIDDVKRVAWTMVAAAEEGEPGLASYRWFFNADGSSCHVDERFADSDAVVAHSSGRAVGEGIPALLQFCQFARFEIHGALSQEAKAMFDALPFAVVYAPFDGFTRGA